MPWLAASGISLLALGLVAMVRPDPKEIAEIIAASDPHARAAGAGRAAPRDPAAARRAAAMLAGLASFGVMVSVMNLSGYVVVEHHHHHQGDVFPIIGAHVFGMYALVLVVGGLIDRIGRMPALSGGLLVMAASTIGLLWFESVLATAMLLFGLGVGWNLSFVAATAQMADLTSPAERGRLLGSTTCSPRCWARRWRSRAATRSTRSASRRSRWARRRSSPRPCCGCCRLAGERRTRHGDEGAEAQAAAGPWAESGAAPVGERLAFRDVRLDDVHVVCGHGSSVPSAGAPRTQGHPLNRDLGSPLGGGGGRRTPVRRSRSASRAAIRSLRSPRRLSRRVWASRSRRASSASSAASGGRRPGGPRRRAPPS